MYALRPALPEGWGIAKTHGVAITSWQDPGRPLAPESGTDLSFLAMSGESVFFILDAPRAHADARVAGAPSSGAMIVRPEDIDA
jgi:hypothetical protein